MSAVKPDTTGLEVSRSAEFTIQLWQYLNRATRTGRSQPAGRRRSNTRSCLHERRSQPSFMLGVWASNSAFRRSSRREECASPVIPSLAALAWAEPRRRRYWESDFINALTIVQRGWATPADMVGSWAGAMGHTQWMPKVWLHVGIDYDGDGKISPYGPPDDALAATARYFVERGKYQRSEHWGCEVRLAAHAASGHSRTYAEWQKLGVVRRRRAVPAVEREGEALGAGARRSCAFTAHWPELHRGQELDTIHDFRSHSSTSATAASAASRSVQQFPGSERAPTLARTKCKSAPAHRARLRHRRRRRPYRHRHRDRRAQLSA